jgi:ribonuclease HI
MTREPDLIAYADGSCLGNPGPGGWGVVFVSDDVARFEFSGAAQTTTNNRMEITAAIEALRRLPSGCAVTIRTDSQYLVKTMTLGWKRRENLDLWKILDGEVARRKVHWEWVRGHAGDNFNQRADQLARNAALGKSVNPPLDFPGELRLTGAGESPQRHALVGHASSSQPTEELPTSNNDESTRVENEAEIVHRLRPLLGANETLRRCAGCHRAFVTTGNPPRGRAYCSLAACQLKFRRNLST